MMNTCEDARHGGVVVFNGIGCPACAAMDDLEGIIEDVGNEYQAVEDERMECEDIITALEARIAELEKKVN